MRNTIFSPAEIMFPPFAGDSDKMNKWAVIACDQFTSEEDYWKRCRELIGNALSTLDYILPEVYLGGDKEEGMISAVRAHSDEFDENKMMLVQGMMYVERTLPNGSTRRGIVGKLDLEKYDYSRDSSSPIRATEETIVERIPSRGKIRAFSKIEVPHILILVSDKKLFDKAWEVSGEKLYDFELMSGGGHIKGYSVVGDALERLAESIEEYEAAHENGVMYAVGDGNHSLAAAKSHWEKLKANGVPATHPARYALCELTPLDDDSLEFEPIYRLVKNCDREKLMSELHKITSSDLSKTQKITVVAGDIREELSFNTAVHPLTQGTLQSFIDEFVSENPGTVCDYIHGEDSLTKLAQEENSVGFLFDGIYKSELFDYVSKNGTLPRKTFSMGEAESKRYYLESRKIK